MATHLDADPDRLAGRPGCIVLGKSGCAICVRYINVFAYRALFKTVRAVGKLTT